VIYFLDHIASAHPTPLPDWTGLMSVTNTPVAGKAQLSGEFAVEFLERHSLQRILRRGRLGFRLIFGFGSSPSFTVMSLCLPSRRNLQLHIRVRFIIEMSSEVRGCRKPVCHDLQNDIAPLETGFPAAGGFDAPTSAP